MLTRSLPTVIGACCFATYPAVSEERTENMKPASTRHSAAVMACLDTLIQDGTDRYGSEYSPMFSSIRDLKTHRMPEQAPSITRPPTVSVCFSWSYFDCT
ncbi:MAG: hypothetical protein HQ582_14175 [Planctomycetes bacterium]|nr:hypothetical protein [Planctomycetota bacterium]